MKKKMIRLTSFTLAVIIILCPLSVSVASSTPEPFPTPHVPEVLGSEELMREMIYFYIWQTLNSWGINISLPDLIGYAGEIGNWIEEELEEWLATVPSINSIDALLFPWKFVWNPSGYLLGNHSALDDIHNFANWIIETFNLSDNSSQAVEGGISGLGEIVVYQLPIAIAYDDSIGNEHQYTWTVYVGSGDTYAALKHNEENTTIKPMFISRNTGVTVKKVETVENSENEYSTNYALNSTYYGWYYENDGATYPKSSFGSMVSYTSNEVNQALKSNNSVTSYGGSMYIITNTIEVPTQSEIGDNSIVITPSGPLYEPVEWDGTVTVDNLPAIVSSGSIRPLDLVSVFAPIKAFANTFADGFDIMVQIIYNMPTAVVSIALTIMAAIAVFDTIKIFKEH